ncbi:MAG: cytochrome c biogenesis protein CcdA [Planctomycetota bacterium]
MRIVFLLTVLFACAAMSAEEQELLQLSGTDFEAAQVAVRVALHGSGPERELAVTFTPVQEPGADPLHLYSTTVPMSGIDGLGRPTRAELGEEAPVQALGAWRVDPDVPVYESSGLPVFEAGPVTLRLPIRLPAGPGETMPVRLLITYQSCTDQSCNRPVERRPITVPMPTHPEGVEAGAARVHARAEADDAGSVREAFDPVALRDLVSQAVRAELDRPVSTGIRWRHARDVRHVEDLIVEAHAAGRSVLLNFTGPSCANCQIMKKTVFLEPTVIAAWNSALPVEVDTDASIPLARWQRDRFGTEARPLYVRLDPDGVTERWSFVFERDDEPTMRRFLDFLQGGRGADAGSGEGWWQFILLAIGGGLFTLVMPCTYPMIPLTVNFFTKQAEGGRRLLPLALAYGGGIVGCFVVVGVVISNLLQATVANFAGNPWVNLIIALLFLVLGLSLLGVFFLRLPLSVQNLAAGGRGGYAGAALMGLTFAITAFTCTAPFAGAVLAEGVHSGSLLRPILGMGLYAGTIAVPFILLALAPGLLHRLPHAGAWMNEFKHIGGLVEIGAALKFLAIADVVWGWGVIARGSTLAAWTGLAAVAGAYTLGWIRMPGDPGVERVGAGRVLFALAWFIAAIWLGAGLLGELHLGMIESFFPADPAPAV